MEPMMLYATWPDADSANTCAYALIEARLAGCVNVLAGAQSTFRWDGKVARESETIMIVKTSAAKASAARDAIIASHPYDVPCVTAIRLEVTDSNQDFITWLLQETV